jgi:hypothetical protein
LVRLSPKFHYKYPLCLKKRKPQPVQIRAGIVALIQGSLQFIERESGFASHEKLEEPTSGKSNIGGIHETKPGSKLPDPRPADSNV